MLTFNERRAERTGWLYCCYLKHSDPVQHELWWSWRCLLADAEKLLGLESLSNYKSSGIGELAPFVIRDPRNSSLFDT